jgi:hypothetical protein
MMDNYDVSDATIVNYERGHNCRLTHFCSAARWSPAADLDWKISGVGPTSLRNPHSSVSARCPMLDPLTLLLVVSFRSRLGRSSSALRKLALRGWTSSKSMPSAVTVSSKSLCETGDGRARDVLRGVLDPFADRENDEDRADDGSGNDGVEALDSAPGDGRGIAVLEDERESLEGDAGFELIGEGVGLLLGGEAGFNEGVGLALLAEALRLGVAGVRGEGAEGTGGAVVLIDKGGSLFPFGVTAGVGCGERAASAGALAVLIDIGGSFLVFPMAFDTAAEKLLDLGRMGKNPALGPLCVGSGVVGFVALRFGICGKGDGAVLSSCIGSEKGGSSGGARGDVALRCSGVFRPDSECGMPKPIEA